MADQPLPADLARALRGRPPAGAACHRLPPGRRREYLTWLDEVKRPETRARRLRRAVETSSGGG